VSEAQALALFPLQTVLFPGGLLNLKVFEARYLDLVGACLRAQSPFGVVCLAQGSEAGPNPKGVRIENVGVLARIDEVDSVQQGILQVRCTGTQRFRLAAAPTQRPDGLWVAPVELLADDLATPPVEAMQATVQALAQAAASLKEQGTLPFSEPLQLDDAGWVANRWCELLPISAAAKQKLMELDDPALRLKLVDEFLRSKQVVRG
jgi:Lon protease-like protein